MIYFISDKIEPWLNYIIEEFSRINELKTEYKLIPRNDYVSNANVIVEYGSKREYEQSIFIPRVESFKADDYIRLREDLPVYKDTFSKINNDYDVFFNAFVHLSRLEEWLAEKNGLKVHSYASRHPRKKKEIWNIPVVNILFNELEKKIIEKFPEVTFGEKQKPVIELSHDIDYIEKTPQLRLKQSAFFFYNAFKNIARIDISEGIKKLSEGVKFALSSCDYWCFDYWEQLEKKYDKRSVFYVYAGGNNKDLRTWLIDPSYDIGTNKKLQEKLKYLAGEGFEIGLHGSYNSAVNENLLICEKEKLEKSLEMEIIKTRQHWLRYEENTTPYIHNKLFKYDSTLGWNDVAGFRSGCASRYRPYDHINQKPFSFYETPQVIMDSNIFDYAADNITSEEKKALKLIEKLNSCKNAHVSISWHQRVCSSDYKWHEMYEGLMNVI